MLKREIGDDMKLSGPKLICTSLLVLLGCRQTPEVATKDNDAAEQIEQASATEDYAQNREKQSDYKIDPSSISVKELPLNAGGAEIEVKWDAVKKFKFEKGNYYFLTIYPVASNRPTKCGRSDHGADRFSLEIEESNLKVEFSRPPGAYELMICIGNDDESDLSDGVTSRFTTALSKK